MISPQLLTVLVDQISLAIKECYHATPDSLLNLLLNGSNHSIVREILDIVFALIKKIFLVIRRN
jgi:hypothetical protein